MGGVLAPWPSTVAPWPSTVAPCWHGRTLWQDLKLFQLYCQHDPHFKDSFRQTLTSEDYQKLINLKEEYIRETPGLGLHHRRGARTGRLWDFPRRGPHGWPHDQAAGLRERQGRRFGEPRRASCEGEVLVTFPCFGIQHRPMSTRARLSGVSPLARASARSKIEDVEKIFKEADANGDGLLSLEELRRQSRA
eukprot:g1713.t2